MAQEARDERNLMRQRGAGTRNVPNPDFDLNFGAGTREERRLMRQRGAGNREVNNIDFGFAFATPVQFSNRVTRTRTKTPATSTRTPIRRNAEDIPVLVSSARSTRSQRLPASTTQRSVNGSTGQPQRKRRRLSEVSDISRATSLELPVVSEINEPEALDTDHGHNLSTTLPSVPEQHFRDSRYDVPSSPPLQPSLNHDEIEANKENIPTTSEALKTTGKKRKRKSIGQQSLFKKKRSSGSSIALLPTPPIIDENLPPEEDQFTDPTLLPTNNDSASPDVAPETLTPISSISIQAPKTTSPIASEPSKRRKKRKSIVGIKKKRKSTDSVSATQTEVIPASDVQVNEELGSTPGCASRSESGLDVDPNQNVSITRGRLRQRIPSSPREDVPQADMHDEDADETYLPDERTPEPTPAPKRVKGRQKLRQSSSSAAGSIRASRKNSGFPILTHRMTNTHELPTIFEEPEQDVSGDAEDTVDELSLPPPAIMTRSTPNAVDVLAQACRETVDGYIRKLKEGLSELSRADRTRQFTALQDFRSNLDVQLFDLSQSLDQRLHMEARLRKQRREKAELQAKWLEVRKQRDRLELRMDAVRRQHWEAEILSRKTWNVSQFAHQLENAISRDETGANQESAAALLEFSLDQLKQDVSSKDGGGVLNILRQLNAQLEQTARTLS